MSARHTNRYTEAQKNALVKAVLIDGLTVAQAVRAAPTGGLGVPAFEIKNRRYAYQLITRRREGFENVNDEAMANSTKAELKRLHALNLAKARGQDSESDPAENARLAKALADSYKALTSAEPRSQGKPKAKPETPKDDDEPDDNALGTLLAIAPKPKPAPQGARAGSVARARTDVSGH